ncbi:uncharacterized protein LOC132736245 [Ruditapes philippinarum]|uniref:uncharacterized protein LOC132736245 n=1 Tax=Ruditapes philippinarum TaxID=129788 RepID=UPI00295B53BB|nr:uncharacterized protein LOC132736245 [Ruditapes philippinarum]
MGLMKSTCASVVLVLCFSVVNGYNSNSNGLGFFSNLLSSPSVSKQSSSPYVYPNTVPVSSYINPVQPFRMPAYSNIAPANRMVYPALMPHGISLFGTLPPHTGHSIHRNVYHHKDVVTKSVLYSVLLSQILRKI